MSYFSLGSWLFFVPGVLGIIFLFFYFLKKFYLDYKMSELAKAGVSVPDKLSLGTMNTKDYALMAQQLQGEGGWEF
jgi:hypothetical protein